MPYLFKKKWCYRRNYYNAGDIVNDLSRREIEALHNIPVKIRNEICVLGSIEKIEKIKRRLEKKNKNKSLQEE